MLLELKIIILWPRQNIKLLKAASFGQWKFLQQTVCSELHFLLFAVVTVVWFSQESIPECINCRQTQGWSSLKLSQATCISGLLLSSSQHLTSLICYLHVMQYPQDHHVLPRPVTHSFKGFTAFLLVISHTSVTGKPILLPHSFLWRSCK